MAVVQCKAEIWLTLPNWFSLSRNCHHFPLVIILYGEHYREVSNNLHPCSVFPAKEASYPNKNISPDILRKNISICGVWCRAIFCTRERRAVRIICCSESWQNWRCIERRFTQEEQYSNSPEFNILRIHNTIL